MNFTKSLAIGFTLVMAVCSLGAHATTPTAPVVKERQENQAERIQQGVASGELTKKETATLRAEQKAIRAEKRAMKADGKLTKKERAHLKREQDQASKRIYSKKHNEKKPG